MVMDDDKDGDIATVTSADELIDAQIIRLAPPPLLEIAQLPRCALFLGFRVFGSIF